MITPTPHQLPVPHHEFYDEKEQIWKPCTTIAEYLLGTRQHHGKWMGKSKAAILACHFISLIFDNAGLYGAQLHPDKPFDDTDADLTIPSSWSTSTVVLL